MIELILKSILCFSFLFKVVRTVSSTYILMGRYNHSLSLDATIMVSKNCPTIDDEHVVVIFVTQEVTIATVLLANNTINYGFRGL